MWAGVPIDNIYSSNNSVRTRHAKELMGGINVEKSMKLEFRVERYYPVQNCEQVRYVISVNGDDITTADTLEEAIKYFDEEFEYYLGYLRDKEREEQNG